jgi:dTDP-4-dehydrorhamnose 3,5-epimerase
MDRLFVSQGLLRIVLYDGRADSPTYERINEFRFGAVRPALLTIPPGVWHGVQNISSSPAVLLNLVDEAYRYEDPDHWRLPKDTEKIPYRFER